MRIIVTTREEVIFDSAVAQLALPSPFYFYIEKQPRIFSKFVRNLDHMNLNCYFHFTFEKACLYYCKEERRLDYDDRGRFYEIR